MHNAIYLIFFINDKSKTTKTSYFIYDIWINLSTSKTWDKLHYNGNLNEEVAKLISRRWQAKCL